VGEVVFPLSPSLAWRVLHTTGKRSSRWQRDRARDHELVTNGMTNLWGSSGRLGCEKPPVLLVMLTLCMLIALETTNRQTSNHPRSNHSQRKAPRPEIPSETRVKTCTTNAARAQDFIVKTVQLLLPNNAKTFILENARTDPYKTACNDVLRAWYPDPSADTPERRQRAGPAL